MVLLGRGSIVLRVGEMVEREVAVAEIHGRGNAKGKMFVDAQFAKHAYRKAGIPSVLVAGDELFRCRALCAGDGLLSDVLKLYVLKVCTHKHTKMERP